MMNRVFQYIVFAFFLSFNLFAQSFKDNLDICLNEKLKEYTNYEYQIMNMPKAYTSIEINNDGEFKLSGNLYYVPVIITNKQSSVKSFIQLRVKLKRDVYCALSNIEKNTNIGNNDVTVKNIEVTQLKGKPAYSLDKILSSKSNLYIKAGEIIYEEMLSKIPVILRETKVTAFLVKGNLEISMDAVAKQDGCPGDIISIQTQNKKKYNAKVIDQDKVNIIE